MSRLGSKASLPTLAAWVFVGVSLTGCGGGPTDAGIGSGADFDLTIRLFGQVTNGAGEGLGQVTIRATTFVRASDCGTEPVQPPSEIQTDEDGNYLLVITLEGDEEFDACVGVEAIPPAELLLQPLATVRQAEARPRDETIEPIQVDFMLFP